ncbi:hypothetical protein D3C81_1567540 [compost metagenome]
MRVQINQHFALEIADQASHVIDVPAFKREPLPGLAVDDQLLQPGDPAVSQFVHHIGRVLVDTLQMHLKKSRGFAGAEAQITQVKLAELRMRAQSRQWHGHGCARAEHEVQIGGCIVEQPLQRQENARVLEMVKVVKHQHQFTCVLRDAVNEGNHPVFDGQLTAVAVKQQACVAPQLRFDHGNTGLQDFQKGFQRVIVDTQR